MKKFLLSIVLVMLLAACGNDEDAQPEEEVSAEEEQQTEEVAGEKEESIEVDKGLLNVEVTLPPSLLESEDGTIDIEEIRTEASKDGIDEVTQNDDGSITYKMSKSKHEELLNSYREEISVTIGDLESGEEFTSIKKIEHNNSYSEFTMIVDKELFENSFDGFATLGIGITGMFYQLFDGASSDDYKVTIEIQDETSGETIDTVVYPDDMNE